MITESNFINEGFYTYNSLDIAREAPKETPELELLTFSNETFAIDIDSILYPFDIPARRAFENLYEETGDKKYLIGAYHSWDEWRSPEDACGKETWEKVIAMVHSPEVILEQTPFVGAVEGVNAIWNNGYEIIYVSNRHSNSVNATTQWLKDQGFPLGELHCIQQDKKDILSKCRYLIDDRPKTLVDFIYDFDWKVQNAVDRKAFSLLYSYNRNLSDIPGIFLSPTWDGITSYLERKGII